MIAASAMSEVSLPYALGLTVLGMAIVFIVLVFLMIIIYVMTALIRRYSVKPAVTAGSAVAADALPTPDRLAPDVPIPEAATPSAINETMVSELSTSEPTAHERSSAVPESATPETTTPAEFDTVAVQLPTLPTLASKKYRVIVNGVEFEVDAEYGQVASISTAPLPEAPAAPDMATLETSVPMPTGATFPMSSGTKKYKVVVNDIEYEVDAETDATPEPVLTNSGTRKYKVIVNDIEYEVDAEAGETAIGSGIEKG